jgi:hypothetical protein
VLWSALAIAGAFRTEDVSAGARWVAHVDLESFRGTRVGAYVLEELNDDKLGKKFAAWEAMFGVDPREDLDSLTAYGTGKENGVAVVRGRLDTQRLITLVEADDNHEQTLHRDHVIHAWTDKKKTGRAGAAGTVLTYGCAYDHQTVVVGDTADIVGEALDVLDGVHAHLDDAGAVGAPGSSVASPFLTVRGRPAEMENLNPQATVFQEARSVSFSAGETGANVEAVLDLDAGDTQKAANIHMVAQGMIGLAAMQAQQEQDAGKAALVNAVKVSLDGSAIRMHLSHPVADVLEMMRSARAGAGSQ